MASETKSNVEAFTPRLAPPTISVIVPCYNAAATISETVESIRAQTVTDFEIIVVDDGSSDNSMELLKKLAQDDGRIRVFLQSNSGPANARNNGVGLARGELIAFLDSDDVWLPNHLARHVHALFEDPRLGLSFSPCDLVDEHSRRTGEHTRVWSTNVSAKDFLGNNPTATCSSLVFRREVFQKAGPMRSDMAYAEDQEWLFRVALTGWLIRGIEEPTVLYRTTTNGLSSDGSKMMDGWRRFIEHARALAPELVERHLAKATAQIQLYHARRAIRTCQLPGVARFHLVAALGASPGTIAARPLYLAALTGAVFAPNLANLALRILRSLRHG